MPRYLLPMSRRRAAVGMVANIAVLVGLCVAVVAVLVGLPHGGLAPSGWAFVAVWIALVVVISVRNTISCARRRFVVWRPSWRSPPADGHRVR